MEIEAPQKDLIPNTKPNRRDKVFCSFSKMVPISEIKEHPKNANQHGREQIEILANAIKSTGWRTPIGVSSRSGYIIRGHGRFAAAKALGLTEVPVDFQEYESEAQELADLLADNKIADLSEIDYEGVSGILKALPEDQLCFTGFRDFEITPLMAAQWLPPAICEVPEFVAGFKFACSEEENQDIRKAIKLVQSKETVDLTDGQCLQKIAVWYLAGVIAQESRLSQDVGPAAKPAKASKASVTIVNPVPAISATANTVIGESKTIVFKVKYVADCVLNENDVTVIRSEDDEKLRLYTIDPSIVATARSSILAQPPYRVQALVDATGQNLWVKSLVKFEDTANATA